MFLYRDIKDYHQQLTNNNCNCTEVVTHYLHQIEAKKKLNAFTEVYADEVLLMARQLDEKRKNGKPLKKLHGVVIAIKDVICYKDHTVTASSKILEGFKS